MDFRKIDLHFKDGEPRRYYRAKRKWKIKLLAGNFREFAAHREGSYRLIQKGKSIDADQIYRYLSWWLLP